MKFDDLILIENKKDFKLEIKSKNDLSKVLVEINLSTTDIIFDNEFPEEFKYFIHYLRSKIIPSNFKEDIELELFDPDEGYLIIYYKDISDNTSSSNMEKYLYNIRKDFANSGDCYMMYEISKNEQDIVTYYDEEDIGKDYKEAFSELIWNIQNTIGQIDYTTFWVSENLVNTLELLNYKITE